MVIYSDRLKLRQAEDTVLVNQCRLLCTLNDPIELTLGTAQQAERTKWCAEVDEMLSGNLFC